MRPKRWNTLRLAGYGSLGGVAFIVIVISVNGGWHTRQDLLAIYCLFALCGAFSGAVWVSVMSAIRNFIVASAFKPYRLG